MVLRGCPTTLTAVAPSPVTLSAGTASLLGARRASLGGSSPDSVRVREARGPTSARGYGDGDGVGDRPSARAVPSAPRRFPSAEPSRTSEDEESEEEREDLAESSLLNKLLHTSLVENSHHVEVLQQDPSSPLFSIRTFEELHLKKELLQGVYTMGFNRPSKIQANALPILMAHPPQNLIAQSQSGTGKTAAFVLAMLSRVKGAERYPQVYSRGTATGRGRRSGFAPVMYGFGVSAGRALGLSPFSNCCSL